MSDSVALVAARVVARPLRLRVGRSASSVDLASAFSLALDLTGLPLLGAVVVDVEVVVVDAVVEGELTWVVVSDVGGSWGLRGDTGTGLVSLLLIGALWVVVGVTTSVTGA